MHKIFSKIKMVTIAENNFCQCVFCQNFQLLLDKNKYLWKKSVICTFIYLWSSHQTCIPSHFNGTHDWWSCVPLKLVVQMTEVETFFLLPNRKWESHSNLILRLNWLCWQKLYPFAHLITMVKRHGMLGNKLQKMSPKDLRRIGLLLKFRWKGALPEIESEIKWHILRVTMQRTWKSKFLSFFVYCDISQLWHTFVSEGNTDFVSCLGVVQMKSLCKRNNFFRNLWIWK